MELVWSILYISKDEIPGKSAAVVPVFFKIGGHGVWDNDWLAIWVWAEERFGDVAAEDIVSPELLLVISVGVFMSVVLEIRFGGEKLTHRVIT